MRKNILHRLLLGLIALLALIALAVMFTARNTTPQTTDTTTTLVPSARPPRPGATTVPAHPGTDKTIPTETLFAAIEQTLDVKGAQAEGVLTIDLPRRDLLVYLDGNEVPAAAGVKHSLIFHRCPCGTMLTHGQFVLLNHELNDVIDALRQDPEMRVVGTSPFLLGSDPALTVLRFQAEGDATYLASLLKGALRWVGDARSAR